MEDSHQRNLKTAFVSILKICLTIFSNVEKKKVEISLQIKKRLEAQGKFDKASFVFKQLANC